ncbi:hypothetical protein Nepgr_028680 [Nepenthes gracilis]|uniref:GBF-interacting protein 1 N-terminal domain-containing protein n=1 Tax=Nepenthes gracilis TaxID=150966 RepID=A0AAD3TE75_NEPGR|nr:hypothetical protein Nepgr_028680 [Nepenthes gracilis]
MGVSSSAESESNGASSKGLMKAPPYGAGAVTELRTRGKRSMFPGTVGLTRNSSGPTLPGKGDVASPATSAPSSKRKGKRKIAVEGVRVSSGSRARGERKLSTHITLALDTEIVSLAADSTAEHKTQAKGNPETATQSCLSDPLDTEGREEGGGREMSTSRGGGSNSVNSKVNNHSSNGVASIPAASKKMVQSLKEIVNCPELEIYAMLKECHMDPNETVNRLISQDPFHEVKSKREKKKEVRKEIKDATDSRSRGASNRGGRSGIDHYASRGSMPPFVSSGSGASLGKPTYKKENEATSFSSNSSPGLMGHNVNHRAPTFSDTSMDNKAFTIDTGEGISSTHLTSGFQPAWCGIPGQVSMADIVKMGRPHGKPSINPNTTQKGTNHHHHVTAPPLASGPHNLCSSQDYPPESGVAIGQHVPPNDDWPLAEQLQDANVSCIADPSVDSGHYADQSNLQFNGKNHQLYSQIDDVQFSEDGTLDNEHSNLVGAMPGTTRKVQEDNSRGSSVFDDDLCKNMSSFQVHRHVFEQQEVEDANALASYAATNLQQLRLSKEGEESPSEAGSPAVKIPDHLQVQSADCSHLSFGSFGSGMSAPFSGPFASMSVKSNSEEASTAAAAAASSGGDSDTRNPSNYGDEHIQTASDGNIAQRLDTSAESYDSHSASQPDVLKQEEPEVTQVHQYSFPSSSTTDYSFENNQQLNSSLAHSQASSQIQNLPPLSGVMAYSNTLPSTLLASSVQSAREAELSYSAFPITRSMPTKYSSTMSSISGPTISMAEALKTSNFSSLQPTQTLLGSSISGGAALPQHLPVHPYSQPSLPLGHFANMISYPFLPQSFTYMPSAFQQTFAGNSTYHQSLAAVLPQYKNSVSASSFPQPAAVASGFGAFGSSTSIPGNIPLNPTAAAAGTSIGYDDILSSHYKDGNHMLSLQQNESSPLWVPGLGSRTMSAVPASTYYSFQGQSQQPAGFRQNQQPSQHYGDLGYPNLYHSQNGLSLEHQQQISRDGALGGSQGQPRQTQQIWQNSY